MDFFKGFTTHQPYTYALMPLLVVGIFNYFYVQRLARADAVRTSDFEAIPGFGSAAYPYEKYTESHTYNLLVVLVLYVALFSTVMYVYVTECKLDYQESAKSAAKIALVPIIALFAAYTIGGKWYDVDALSGRNKIAQALTVYALCVLTINYAYYDCKKPSEIEA